jgi:NAD(P)-dependent dehydrogenase (short-subunit alcohol dehydrogenase family)
MAVAVAARTAAQVTETASAIREGGGAALAVAADVADPAAVAAMSAAVERELGPVDLLVNNAGAGPPFGPAWECDPGQWWRNVEVNLKGAFLCCRALLPGMIARGRGRIINVASGAGTRSIPYMSAYVTSKAALIRFTEVLAEEARPRGIAVFAIQPGTVRTAMSEELMHSEAGARWLPWFRRIFDEGLDDSPEQGVELIKSLASGKADRLSGRFFIAPGDPEEMAKRADEIERGDLQVLRMRFLE